VAGIYFVLTFILAGFDWLSSGGDKGKVEKAQNRMTSAAIGLLIVIIALGIIGVVGGVFGLDILNLDKLINSIIPGRTSTPNLPYVPPGQQILTP
jgi:amino acid transporter